MMQSDHQGLRAVRLTAIKQCAVPRAVKQSSVPQGHRQGSDGAETGDTVEVSLKRRKIVRVVFREAAVYLRSCTSIWPVLIIAFRVQLLRLIMLVG